MVKYTLFVMILHDGRRVYYVEFGQWMIAGGEKVVILAHGLITRYHYSEYQKDGKVPMFFDGNVKSWMIENPYNDEYYKTIDTDKSMRFVTWLYPTDRKEVFSNESCSNEMVSDSD